MVRLCVHANVRATSQHTFERSCGRSKVCCAVAQTLAWKIPGPIRIICIPSWNVPSPASILCKTSRPRSQSSSIKIVRSEGWRRSMWMRADCVQGRVSTVHAPTACAPHKDILTICGSYTYPHMGERGWSDAYRMRIGGGEKVLQESKCKRSWPLHTRWERLCRRLEIVKTDGK